jgi:hypothetical protein
VREAAINRLYHIAWKKSSLKSLIDFIRTYPNSLSSSDAWRWILLRGNINPDLPEYAKFFVTLSQFESVVGHATDKYSIPIMGYTERFEERYYRNKAIIVSSIGDCIHTIIMGSNSGGRALGIMIGDDPMIVRKYGEKSEYYEFELYKISTKDYALNYYVKDEKILMISVLNIKARYKKVGHLMSNSHVTWQGENLIYDTMHINQ